MGTLSFLTSAASIVTGVVGELVAPSCCAACDEPVRPNILFCAACEILVDRAEPLDQDRQDRGAARSDWVSVFDYGGAIATAITRMKYGARPDLGRRLGGVMGEAAKRLVNVVDVVVPVPLHPRRLADRGYNQSALLAGPVARRLDVPHLPRALDRVRDTPRQAGLPRSARLSNLGGAFVARRHGVVRGCRVLLVDDVRTTGATLEACAEALDREGVRQILAFVLASTVARDAEPPA